MLYPFHYQIVIHCSATQNGKSLRNKTKSAAQVIDSWHKQRGLSVTYQHQTF
ncbi:Uncharacterised protein [Avibacterium paragallinarum]|uniref:N-acetylmuramoyl-L-alanine amidase n=1 Tax=Avibacterium paragallinarum TaxID=728 RepID=A0A380Z6G2_AVIPA|nr:Uncharacterised protein [Avibacterium paragallinarum]